MEYIAKATHDGGMRFNIMAGSHELVSDYPLDPEASGDGARPLELLLASLAACAGGTLVALLKRSQQPLKAMTVTARGDRRAEHPTVFTSIALDFVIAGDLAPEVVNQALQVAETRVCPVWAMLKPTTPITATFRIEPAPETAAPSLS